MKEFVKVQRDESAEDTEDQTDGPLAEAMSTSHLASVWRLAIAVRHNGTGNG